MSTDVSECQVSIDEMVEANRRNWDERAPVHAHSRFYDLAAIRAGKDVLHPLECEELGDVRGRDLLHLMCHIGTDTVCWARRGARVTGVDQSGGSLAVARELARDCGQTIDWLQANVLHLPTELYGRFDIAIASYGITSWLPDMQVFCAQAVRCLRPGGTLLLIDDHPLRWIFPSDGQEDLRVVEPYFRTGEVEYCPPGPTYTDGGSGLSTATYQWEHTVGDIINGVVAAGLQVESFREFPFTFWPCRLPEMFQDGAGWWRSAKAGVKLPLMFSLRARKGEERR